MDQRAYWTIFKRTGKVTDYLQYIDAVRREPPPFHVKPKEAKPVDHRRTDHT